jgi:oligopeptide/dipeptide ABC transporter ATP-binding protein
MSEPQALVADERVADTATTDMALLEIRGLDVRYRVTGGSVHAVRGLDLSVRRGEVAALVGESGSGKSATMLGALGLLDPNATVSGSVKFEGVELIGAPNSTLRHVRGGRIGMIFQDPMTSLNPVLTIGRQIAEAVITHQKVSPKHAESMAVELLESVSLPNAQARIRSYPHELSGGMRQRVMIAMALANKPDILIADEPTTALDVTIQAQILQVLRDLQRDRGLAIVLITHDLGVVASLADSVHVMYAGNIVEAGPVVDTFHRPNHPYTAGLLASLPRLDRPERELVPIGGTPPSLREDPKGCAFAPRCRFAVDACHTSAPVVRTVDMRNVACDVLPFGDRSSAGRPGNI